MRFWVSGSAVVLVLGILAGAQTPKAAPGKTAVHKANELTLAGLRPGQDSASRASQLYGSGRAKDGKDDGSLIWAKACQTQTLSVDLDSKNKIQVIRAVELPWSLGDCKSLSPGPWKTGLGLRVGDPRSKVAQLYGEPDSKSPSSKGGQQLELWYYAFDWAGPDVPQVMEILCTVDEGGKPGRVVEITLAAPSL
jgi:hypothetical protein